MCREIISRSRWNLELGWRRVVNIRGRGQTWSRLPKVPRNKLYALMEMVHLRPAEN